LLVAACNSNELKVKSTGSPNPGQPQQQGQAPVFADGVRRVTVNELQALLEKDQAMVIDVRTAEAYNIAHVKGARLIPEAEVGNHAKELPADKLIVTYCS
jgi:hypothetical protein